MTSSYFQRDRDWHPPALTPAYKTSILRSPRHALLSLPTSHSEETGPVFGHDMLGPLDNDLIRNFARDGGEAIGQRSWTSLPGRSAARSWSSGKPTRAAATATRRKATSPRSIRTSGDAGAPSRTTKDAMRSARSSPAPTHGPTG
jgi:hypothetical protein